MRPGETANIRINPTDCMSVADLVQLVGAFQPGMSFSSAVSIALASAMESFRLAGRLPTRVGFEYESIMQPFSSKKHTGRKLAITNARFLAGSDLHTPAIQLPGQPQDAAVPPIGLAMPVSVPVETAPVASVEDIQMREVALQLKTLDEKRELARAEPNAVSWTQGEEAEWKRLCVLVYGG